MALDVTGDVWVERAEACSDAADHADMCAGETRGVERSAFLCRANLGTLIARVEKLEAALRNETMTVHGVRCARYRIGSPGACDCHVLL